MKSVLRFLKTTLIGGLLVVVPVWVLLLLVLKVATEAEVVVKPITTTLPSDIQYPQLLAAGLLLAACFLAGLAVRTAVGRYAKAAVERHLLEKVPGYATLRGMSEQLADMNRETGFQASLVEMEGGLVPALIVERHADGRCTVFVPSAPTPISGTIFIFPGEKVHPANVPLMVHLKCVSKYGAGSHEILAALRPPAPPTTGLSSHSPTPPITAGILPDSIATGGLTREK